MFRTMRRAEKAMDIAQAEDILRTATHGVLSVCGDGGYPYGVPVSFAYDAGKIYFHSTSQTSHKIDSIRNNEKVSLCVVTEDNVKPEKFDTAYTSVIAFGRARVLSKDDEINYAMVEILNKYSKDFMESGKKYIAASKAQDKFVAVEVTVENITGKIGR